jgi:aryl-alcohol dehydrogenase-like predicted oxidoreductase
MKMGDARVRTVYVPSLGRDVSVLGFGCAPLGSHVSEAQGRRSLDAAFERGVTWYDVAPPYGDGEAETILGKFLSGRRDRVTVCTKFGIPRQTISSLARFARPVARAALRAFPFLRSSAEGARPAGWRVPLRAEMVEPSLTESLRRLRTDYVDVLALHDPQPEECMDEDLLAALQRVVEKGYARTIGIAGTPEAIAAGVQAASLYKIAEFRDTPFHQALEPLHDRLDASLAYVTYGAFDPGVYDHLIRILSSDGGRLASLASQLAYGPPNMASDILLDYALAKNSAGIVLVSMFDPVHIELNCARASRRPRADVVDFVHKMIVNAASANFGKPRFG